VVREFEPYGNCVTKAKKEEAEQVMLLKLKFMGRIQAEKVSSTGTVNYEEIARDAENILAADDVVVGF
jgi:hypothetical protein